MSYGLYIHIPYCRSRCRYCDFYTAAANGAVPDAYIQAILRDFTRYAPKNQDGSYVQPQTVYFGGGTPGLLTPQQVQTLLTAINPAPHAEITVETNPDLASLQKLQGWRAAGVNRLSIGVQTASDESLRKLGRTHTAQDARTAFANAKATGYPVVSGDIMMALPSYSTQEFDQTLALLADGGANHISAYLLKIEEGTPFGKNPPPHLPSVDESAEFYLYGVQQLQKAGYYQYEISNFTSITQNTPQGLVASAHAAVHNLIYWDCRDYLGLGPAAYSCMQNKRFHFAPDTAAFLADTLLPQMDDICDGNDYIMLRLRLNAGLSEQKLYERFGQRLTAGQQDFLQILAKQGLAHQTNGNWALTPQGMLVQNAILAQLLQ